MRVTAVPSPGRLGGRGSAGVGASDRSRPVGRRQGSRIVKVEPRPSWLQTLTRPPWLAADVLDDGQPQAGAAGGPRAGGVDPVEALEDPLQLGRRDADALVGHGDLDVVAVDPAGADADPGAGVAVVDGVRHQVARPRW